MKCKAFPLLILALGIFLAGCSITRELPIFRPTATPTATVTPIPTATLTPTVTPTPTSTPSPTPAPAAMLISAAKAITYGDYEAARSTYLNAAQESEDDAIQAASLLGIARANYLEGNYREARDGLLNLIQAYPDKQETTRAYFFLGQTYSALSAYPEAAEAYLNYLTRRTGIIDAYVHELRGDALFAAGDYAGAAQSYALASQSTSLLDQNFLSLKRARSLGFAGDSESALALYDEVFQRSDSASTRALINLRKGQIYTTLGQMDQAYAAYQDSVNNYQSAYEAYSGLLVLVENGIPVDELNRGIVDYYAGQYGVAIAAFDRYLNSSPTDPGSAWYFTGLSYQASGNYSSAIAAWDQLIEGYPQHGFWDDAVEEKAFTQWYYLDQYQDALGILFGFTTNFPDHPRAAEFLFDAGVVAERAGLFEQASDIYARVGNEYPNFEDAQRARFLAGISRYRAKDYPGAQQLFEQAMTASLNLGDRAAASLWIGKCQEAQGDDKAAQQTWRTTAGIDPTGYYSERAADLLAGRAPFQPPRSFDLVVDMAHERRIAESWLKKTFDLPEGTDLSGLGVIESDLYLIRGTELWNLGLTYEARNEFEQLRRTVAVDPVLSYRLMNYLIDLGVYRSAILTARQVLDLAGMDDAGTMAAPAYFNHIRFGAYFGDLVIPTAEEYEFHPLLIFSVIRQESLFESFVRSSAAANGLMQIIPATGEELANDLGWPAEYATSDLYRPVINVRFGVHYLNKQRNRFDGEMYPSLAAYNAGPGNAMVWRELAPADPDLFLEVVSYSETRNYIRGIYEIYNIYRRIYERTS